MILKNKKAIVAIITAALATNAILPVATSASSYVTNPDITRSKAEALAMIHMQTGFCHYMMMLLQMVLIMDI